MRKLFNNKLVRWGIVILAAVGLVVFYRKSGLKIGIVDSALGAAEKVPVIGDAIKG